MEIKCSKPLNTKIFAIFETLLKSVSESYPLSCNLSAHFLNFHRTHLKSGQWLPAAFLKSSLKIWEMCGPMGRVELELLSSQEVGKFKRFWCEEVKNLFKHLINLKNLNKCRVEKILNSWQTSCSCPSLYLEWTATKGSDQDQDQDR
jgi:hypothetical protein